MFSGPFLSTAPFLAFLIVLLILVKILGSPRFKGWLGETMVIEAGLKKLDPASYRHYHDLYLPRPDARGSTQIDHVVVSPFGIFVIETKNYKGWIFGSEKQLQWTQQIYRSKHRFRNPLHQNHLHVEALMGFLGLPETSFRPVVFFIGGAEFKTPMPPNVLDRGLLPWIKRHTATLLDPASLRRIHSSLDELDLTTDRKAASRDHLKAIQARIG
ncbi:MAG: nuclease-related domain-containing protein [Verrucomicrobiota bacterium]